MAVMRKQNSRTRMLTFAAERLQRFRGWQKIGTAASGKRVSAVVVWLSIVTVAWLLARACAFALSPPALPPALVFSSLATQPGREPGAGMRPISHFAVLETNNLFTLKSHAPRVAMSATTLNAILMGTVEAPLPENTRAVIQHQGKQHMLRPGQDIAGFVVKEIRRGVVVLEANGRTVELVTGNAGNALPAGMPGGARGIR